jgi:hypothetical protein
MEVLEILEEQEHSNCGAGVPPALIHADDESRVRLVDFRRALSSDNREERLLDAGNMLREAAQDGYHSVIVWPTATGLAAARNILGLSLAHVVVALLERHRATATVECRNGHPADFLALAPYTGISFSVNLNAEEAAMRWERDDAPPRRRIAAAARLLRAGWNTSVALGPIRPISDWKTEYGEIIEAASTSGLEISSLQFPGEDVFGINESDFDGLVPVTVEDGVIFTIEPRRRREIMAWLSSQIAVAKFPSLRVA